MSWRFLFKRWRMEWRHRFMLVCWVFWIVILSRSCASRFCVYPSAEAKCTLGVAVCRFSGVLLILAFKRRFRGIGKICVHGQAHNENICSIHTGLDRQVSSKGDRWRHCFALLFCCFAVKLGKFVECKTKYFLGSLDISKKTSNTFHRFDWEFQSEFGEYFWLRGS